MIGMRWLGCCCRLSGRLHEIREWSDTMPARGGAWFLFFLWRLLRCRRGILSHAQERRHEEVFGLGDCFAVGLGSAGACSSQHHSPGGCCRRERWPPACRRSGSTGVRGDWGIVSHAQERWHPALRRGRRGRLGLVFWFGGFFHALSHGQASAAATALKINTAPTRTSLLHRRDIALPHSGRTGAHYAAISASDAPPFASFLASSFRPPFHR